MKLFEARSKLKDKIHGSYKNLEYLDSFFINQRDIRYCHLGTNIGYEEDGKGEEFRRPVLVIKKIGNMYRIAPMTSKPKNDNKFYHILDNDNIEYYQETAKVDKSGAILSQIRVIDKTRFIYKAAEINKIEFEKVIKKLKTLLF